jgi:hypothetical protein
MLNEDADFKKLNEINYIIQNKHLFTINPVKTHNDAGT